MRDQGTRDGWDADSETRERSPLQNFSGLAAWLPVDDRGYVAIGEEIDRQILAGERPDPWMRWGHDPGDEDRS